MVEFKEPKVEFIELNKKEVVYASTTAGNVQSCNGGVMANYEYCQEPMVSTAEKGE